MRLFKSKIRIRTHLHSEYKPSLFTGFLHAVFWLPYSIGLLVLTVIASLVIVLLGVCNAVGLALLWSPKLVFRAVIKSWTWLAQDIKNTVVIAPRRVSLLKQRQFAYGIIIFIGVVFSFFGTLEVGNLFAGGLELKGRVLGQVSDAISNLQTGKEYIYNEDLESAQNQFGQSLDKFKQSSETLRNGNVLISSLLSLLPTGRNVQKLLDAGESGTKTALHLTNFVKILHEVNIDENGFKPDALNALRSAQSELALAHISLTSSVGKLSDVNTSHIPVQYRKDFEKIYKLLTELNSSLQTLSSSFDVLLSLAEGNKHLLILLQNSNELRATGGFIGTFGAFDLDNGVVQKRNISSIYDLDGQLNSEYTPPLPMYAVNNRWFMRDSNWFASFPESAEAIKSFYVEETGVSPDVILAITPEIIEKLLRLTGPIYLPKQNLFLDAENFVEVTQVETSLNYDKELNKPKQMLADLFPILLSKIISLPRSDLPKLLTAFEQSLASKDVLLYYGDKHVAQILSKLGFDGRFADTTRDYLNIVSSNLGGTKTDLAMKQSVNLSTDIRAGGKTVNTLKIYRENPLPHVSGLENKSFIRIYVPLGSKLLSAKGFSYVDVDAKFGSDKETHPQVVNWEKNTIKEVSSGMLVGIESGKTFYGNWVVLEGGQSQTLELVYELPFRLGIIDRHSIVVQKQPGANNYIMNYELNISGYRMLWGTDASIAGSKIQKELDISRDRFYGIVLQSY